MLRATAVTTVLIATAALATNAPGERGNTEAVASRIVAGQPGERVLIQTARVKADLKSAWNAYTTNEGWTAWAAPVADIDLRVGGTIKTHYVAGAKIGSQGTNTLRIVGYVPERLLVLRAEPSALWSDELRRDADRFTNVIVFTPVSQSESDITSYGIGYRDSAAHAQLLAFFEKANVKLLHGLVTYLGSGKRARWK